MPFSPSLEIKADKPGQKRLINCQSLLKNYTALIITGNLSLLTITQPKSSLSPFHRPVQTLRSNFLCLLLPNFEISVTLFLTSFQTSFSRLVLANLWHFRLVFVCLFVVCLFFSHAACISVHICLEDYIALNLM